MTDAQERPSEAQAESERLRKRFDRERKIRQEAESIAERVTAELYASVKEHERLNAALENANDELEAANQAIRDFVSVASHDLRGPLTSILGYVSLMRDRWDDLEATSLRNFLAIVEKQGQRLNRLVEDLLTVSKIESGAVEAHIQEIHLDRMLEEVVRDMGEPMSEVLISRGPVELFVRADPDHVSRILTNFLTNALKYGRPPIEAGCRDGGSCAEIRISDHGDGVPADFIPRLFEKFARAEDATQTAEGTGLGLSIVRGLARANGGDAWYESNEPSGACFAVRFPKAG